MTEAAVVLAGGGGSRFVGELHKLRTPIRGRAMVSWVFDAVERLDGIDERIVVTGAADLDDLVPLGWTVLFNHDWELGQSTSLMVAIDWARLQGYDAITVGLGDQPGIGTDAWKVVLSQGRRPITVGTYGGKRRNPVRLSKTVWDRLPAEGDFGARALMKSFPELVEDVPCEGNPLDIDTVEDLRSWR
jgi:CTP:molybdopterin cytidylyltransferase MocA